MAKVTVAVYRHRFGEDVRVFASQAGAHKWRNEIAAEYWHGSSGDKPADAGEMASQYFEFYEMHGMTESFSSETCDVEE